jgi:hypothetical protein
MTSKGTGSQPVSSLVTTRPPPHGDALPREAAGSKPDLVQNPGTFWFPFTAGSLLARARLGAETEGPPGVAPLKSLGSQPLGRGVPRTGSKGSAGVRSSRQDVEPEDRWGTAGGGHAFSQRTSPAARRRRHPACWDGEVPPGGPPTNRGTLARWGVRQRKRPFLQEFRRAGSVPGMCHPGTRNGTATRAVPGACVSA